MTPKAKLFDPNLFLAELISPSLGIVVSAASASGRRPTSVTSATTTYDASILLRIARASSGLPVIPWISWSRCSSSRLSLLVGS